VFDGVGVKSVPRIFGLGTVGCANGFPLGRVPDLLSDCPSGD
jgi:hypothetical protein